MSNTCHVVSNAVEGNALRTAWTRSQADNEGNKVAAEGRVIVQPSYRITLISVSRQDQVAMPPFKGH